MSICHKPLFRMKIMIIGLNIHSVIAVRKIIRRVYFMNIYACVFMWFCVCKWWEKPQKYLKNGNEIKIVFLKTIKFIYFSFTYASTYKKENNLWE
jgi:hypothetical protein